SMTEVTLINHISLIIQRLIAYGHSPVTNKYNNISTYSIMIILGYLITYHYYKSKVLDLFAIPISLLLIAYGSLFSTDANPLIPSLQSNCLTIHVITVTIS